VKNKSLGSELKILFHNNFKFCNTCHWTLSVIPVNISKIQFEKLKTVLFCCKFILYLCVVHNSGFAHHVAQLLFDTSKLHDIGCLNEYLILLRLTVVKELIHLISKLIFQSFLIIGVLGFIQDIVIYVQLIGELVTQLKFKALLVELYVQFI